MVMAIGYEYAAPMGLFLHQTNPFKKETRPVKKLSKDVGIPSHRDDGALFIIGATHKSSR